MLQKQSGAVASAGLRLQGPLRSLINIWIAEDSNAPAANTLAGQTTMAVASEGKHSSGWLIAFVAENGAIVAAFALVAALWVRSRYSQAVNDPKAGSSRREVAMETIIVPPPNEVCLPSSSFS